MPARKHSYLNRARTLADRLGRGKPPHETNGHSKSPASKAQTREAVKEEAKKRVSKKKVLLEDTLEHRLQLEREHPEYVHTDEKGLEILAWAKTLEEVSLDTETHGLLYVHHSIRLIQLFSGGQTFILDGDHLSHSLVVHILRALKGKPLYVHNATFDLPRIYRWFGVLLSEDVRDTALLSKHARAGEWRMKKTKDGYSPETIKHSLKDCLKRECKIKIPKDTGDSDKDQWGGGLSGEQLRYSIDDVTHLKTLYEQLLELAREREVLEAYEDVRRVLPLYVRAMTRGVPINVDALRSLLQAAKEERDYWDEEAHRIMRETGHEPPIVSKSKTRYEQFWSWRNTNKAHKPEGRRGALKALSLVGVKVDDLQERTLLDNLETHPLVRAIYQHNKKARLVSQYQKWETHFYEDGRVFPQFNLAGTVTNRTLTADPNVQGTSKHKNLEFRAMIKAPSGKKLLKADWSQQEVRIAAFYSKDPEMLRVYRERDTDVYRRTAEELVGHPVDKEDPERQFAKRIVLGFLYGLGIARYQKNTYKDYGEWFEEDKAQEHRNAFRRAFPEYRRWQQLQGTCCVEIDGEVYEYDTQEERFTTRSRRGRRRYVKPDSEGKPKFTDLINGPIQTTGADILYVALGRLRDDQERGLFTRCRFILSSHDEILLEVPDDEEGRAAKNWLSGHMSDVLEEILSSELGGEECVEALLVDDWSQQQEKKEEVAA